jgi:hypothetical protein
VLIFAVVGTYPCIEDAVEEYKEDFFLYSICMEMELEGVMYFEKKNRMMHGI